MPVPVSTTSITASPLPRRPLRTTVPSADVCLTAFESNPIRTCRRSSGSPSAARPGSTSTVTSIPSFDAAEGQKRLHEPVHPLDVFGEPPQEMLEGLRIVLGASLQHLDSARDPGQRIAQLVCGVGDELTLGELAPHLLGAVADHHQDPLLGGEVARLQTVD